LLNLGSAAMLKKDFAAAERLYERALVIQRRLAPDTLFLSTTLSGQAALAEDLGDRARAKRLCLEVLAIQERLAPGGLGVAGVLDQLAQLAAKAGELAQAEESCRQALAIRRKLASGSIAEADSLHLLGTIRRRLGHGDEAMDLFLGTLDALEAQNARLGGTFESRAGFAAKYADYYQDAMEMRIEQGRLGDAVHILERSRARAFLALLGERDLLFTADLPSDLRQARRLVDAEYDRTQGRLGRADAAERERLLGRLNDLRQKQEELTQDVRRASPRYAALRYPQPLDLDGIREMLDPGTVFLAYSVGKERTLLFVVHASGAAAPGVSVATVQVSDEDLRARIAALRKATHPRQPWSEYVREASGLYELLIRPVEPQIASAERVLISPDGPLYSLPFAALIRSRDRGASARGRSYFVEWKPLHVVASATIYAQLKARRRAAEGEGLSGRLVAFGAPRYPRTVGAQPARLEDPQVQSAVTRGFRLQPLIASADEVQSIARLFADQATTYLGEQATEERAKAIGADARYVHFACHGTLDERFPLNSALALTLPEKPAEQQDNGLLQAWEIFDQVRLEADLVTMSACDTARGKEMSGEGLIGLVGAFHYAGARSVLATLWGVSDKSTSVLMRRFYSHLKAGQSHDQALRSAQLDLIHSTAVDLAHPFRWAAFQLSGDWK
jgi:CHAT domain-containing protein